MALILRYFRIVSPNNLFWMGELQISLWSLGNHDMTLPLLIRTAKVHEQDHGDEEPSEPPAPDLDNQYTEDSYHLQDSDIEELTESHGNYSARMPSLTISPSILLLPMCL